MRKENIEEFDARKLAELTIKKAYGLKNLEGQQLRNAILWTIRNTFHGEIEIPSGMISEAQRILEKFRRRIIERKWPN